MSSTPFEPALALEITRRLSHDDDFRDLFRTDPVAALVQVGVPHERAEALRICCKVGRLASKEAILEAQQEIRTMLTAGLGQIVPALDANPKGSHNLKSP